MNLKGKIKNKKARIRIVGRGYAGLLIAVYSAKARFQVIGLDIEEKKIIYIILQKH